MERKPVMRRRDFLALATATTLLPGCAARTLLGKEQDEREEPYAGPEKNGAPLSTINQPQRD